MLQVKSLKSLLLNIIYLHATGQHQQEAHRPGVSVMQVDYVPITLKAMEIIMYQIIKVTAKISITGTHHL